MTDKLPPQLLALFQSRPALRYLPPPDDAPETRGHKRSELSGVAAFLPQFEEYKETDEYEPTESWLQRKQRTQIEKQEQLQHMLGDDFEGFKPDDDPKVKGDAVKTLFVARLGYDVREPDLEREFGRFGPVERIRIVRDESGKYSKKPHRGYAFIVFERERDMKAAYKETDGIRIKDRKVLVDVERGRMVKGWKPRRFGGGLGGRNYTKAPPKPTFGGPPAGPGFQSGGFQGGGFRGGFRGRGGGGFGGGFRGDRNDRGDRGGYGSRGGVGFQGGGGFGGRQGGYQNGAPPPNAPSGPGGRGSFGASNSYDDRGRSGYGGGGGGGFGGGGRDRGGMTGSNREPVQGRDRGYEDRDRYGGGRRDEDYGSRKRHHENDGYDDPRSKRRY